MAEILLVTGGVRSGKSRRALAWGEARPGPRTWLATAEPFDDELRERIARHQAERGDRWETVEEPLDLAAALRGVRASGARVAVVDCLTVWTGNLLHHRPDGVPAARDALLAELDAWRGASDAPDLALVTNEVGWGIQPDNALARRFQDELGATAREAAARSTAVELLVAGIPLRVR